jgi:hypothetical protein
VDACLYRQLLAAFVVADTQILARHQFKSGGQRRQPANSLLNGVRDQAQGVITRGPAGSSASKHVPYELVLIREVSL